MSAPIFRSYAGAADLQAMINLTQSLARQRLPGLPYRR